MKIRFERTRPRFAKDPTTILAVTQKLLEGNGHVRFYALEDIARTIDDTYRNVLTKVRIYKWAALALLTLIPILSAFMSIAITENKNEPSEVLQQALAYVSYLLTLLTILSSIFNPGERFKKVCQLGIKVDNLRAEALESLECLAKEKEVHPHDMVKQLRDELEPYRVQLIDLFLPETQIKTAGPNRDDKAAGNQAAGAAMP